MFNGNPDFADFKNFDGKQLFNQSYDALRWKKAADAAKAAILQNEELGKALYRVADADPFMAGFKSTKNMFWDGWRQEGVWTRVSSDIMSWTHHAAPKNSNSGLGWNGIGVVQELVDDFRMADGKTIGETASYNETTYTTAATDYYAFGTNRMYAGRG